MSVFTRISDRGQDAQSSPAFVTSDDAKLRLDNAGLVERLQGAVEAANDALPSAEATERLIWELGKHRQSVIQNLLVSTKHVTIVPYEDDFFQQDWASDETEREQRQTLADVFSIHTSHQRLYRVGGS